MALPIQSACSRVINFYSWIGYDYSNHKNQICWKFAAKLVVAFFWVSLVVWIRVPSINQQYGALNDLIKLIFYFSVLFTVLFESIWYRKSYSFLWEIFEQISAQFNLVQPKDYLEEINNIQSIHIKQTALLLSNEIVWFSFCSVIVAIQFFDYVSSFWISQILIVEILIDLRQFQVLFYIKLLNFYTQKLDCMLKVVANKKIMSLSKFNIETKVGTQVQLLLYHGSEAINDMFGKSLLIFILRWNLLLLTDMYWTVQAVYNLGYWFATSNVFYGLAFIVAYNIVLLFEVTLFVFQVQWLHSLFSLELVNNCHAKMII